MISRKSQRLNILGYTSKRSIDHMCEVQMGPRDHHRSAENDERNSSINSFLKTIAANQIADEIESAMPSNRVDWTD